MNTATTAAGPVNAPGPAPDAPVLQVKSLGVSVLSRGTRLRVLDDVSFEVPAGGAMGLVGESGSGKSLTLRAIMGLLPDNVAVDGGDILFQGRSLVSDGGLYLRRIRGSAISMVFQEPAVALNPVMRVGEQISDAVAQRRGLSKRAARALAVDLMNQVGVPDAARKVDAYPFELSGGLRQRVMIAASVASEPALILCDEPTTALDVTIQAQVLGLFARLRDELGAGLLYVTHDMAVVAQLCQEVTVLYSGRVMEQGPIRALFDAPEHPYTAALLQSTPRIEGPVRRLESIPGTAPGLAERPEGCPFAPRCHSATEQCRDGVIPFTRAEPDRRYACLHPMGGAAFPPAPAGPHDTRAEPRP